MHPILQRVTKEVIERSHRTREAYLERVKTASSQTPHRTVLGCGNLAHGFAACSSNEKADMATGQKPNIAIISSYNDMLSAHEPYKDMPQHIKRVIEAHGGLCQFAGGVPAMCDGITQGQPGMELSLFSRDVVAMSTVIGLSHNMFDGALYLGVCDKIVPGLLMGALSFGHLPAIFVPAGPMTSGITNKEKARARQKFAEGKIGREELLESESKSYHSPGTCTFYGTANSNQMMVELMGLHLPGSSFINPYTPLRDALTEAAAKQILKFTPQLGQDFRPVGEVVDEKAILNALIGLLATGGSTNHTMHLVAIARMAGIIINWNDFDNLSKIIPLIARVYPNGPADVNDFQNAGGLQAVISQLLSHGLLHEEILTVGDHKGLGQYVFDVQLEANELVYSKAPTASRNTDIISAVDTPFAPIGGIHLMRGNLGRGISKVSAVSPEHHVVEAPAMVFDDQEEMLAAFRKGELERDFVAVIRFQGPRSNGMPELHKLTPPLGLLQDKGFKVALLTDGRMSGASGKVPAAIHMYPECINGGPLAKVRNGDIIHLDIMAGVVNILVDEEEFDGRIPDQSTADNHHIGMGRELFGGFRLGATTAETGASNLFVID